MTMECTIRFQSRITAQRFFETILTTAETETVKCLVGGFYFTTDRRPATIFADIDSEGFELADFENIEFRPL